MPFIVRIVVGAYMYVGGPMALYEKMRVLRRTALVPLSPDHPLPPVLSEYLTDSESRLTSAGFAPPVRAESQLFDSTESYASFLEHPRDGALCFVHVSRFRQSNQVNGTVVFRSEFENGAALVTSNQLSLSRKPPMAGFDAVQLPEIDDAGQLYEIHRFRVREYSVTSPLVRLTRGANPLEFEERDSDRAREHWVRHRYYERGGDGVLYLTIRGACLTAWRGMFPWHDITEARRARKARAVLARFALVGPSRAA